MAERLHFSESAMEYMAMVASEHLSRYLIVKKHCAGRRVLDIACGEGYGTALLKSWGASSVVGVDVSEEAIERGNSLFGAPGVRFICHDACTAGALVEEIGRFDLIVCLETIEHVDDVQGLLTSFKELLADNGAIVISCPNDAAVISDAPNEFHVKTYSLNEFLASVQQKLGKPSDIAIGTSVLGFSAMPLDSSLLNSPPKSLVGMLAGEYADVSMAVPAQVGHEVPSELAAYFVAAWGCKLSHTCVVSPISYQAYEAPWRNWMATKADLDLVAQKLRAAQISIENVVEEKNMAILEFGEKMVVEREINESLRRLNDETVKMWERAELQLAQIASSKLHRAVRAYYGVYRIPVIGRILTSIRGLFLK